jgi:hypothetical protein
MKASYNSVVIASVEQRSYHVFFATENVLRPGSTSSTLYEIAENLETPYFLWDSRAATSMKVLAETGKLDRLETGSCIAAYATDYQFAHGNLMVVSKNTDTIPKKVHIEETTNPNWMCGDIGNNTHRLDCTAARARKLNPTAWRPFGRDVNYCLSEPVVQKCKLQYLTNLGGVIVAFNFIKLLVLLVAFIDSNRANSPLLTIGDAIASFLETPDETTRLLDLMGWKDIHWWKNERPTSTFRYRSRTKRWWSAVSSRRWTLTLLL